MGSALDSADDWPAWSNSVFHSEQPAAADPVLSSGPPKPAPSKAPPHYADWQLTPERQRHEWKRARRAIVSIRIRLVVYGHVLFFAGCFALSMLGLRISHEFTSVGCYSLLVTSIGLLIFEWLHVRFQPRHPPRFVVRPSGVTEYGDEGPLNHWDWARIRQLRLVTDHDRPDFRSLVFVSSGFRWVQKFQRITIPLPEAEPLDEAAIDESTAIGAIGIALSENGFQWKPHLSRNDLRIEKY